MRLYIDARLPFGSGIGRYVSEVLPHVADLRPNWQMTLGVSEQAEQSLPDQIRQAKNISVLPMDVAPFSLNEQKLRAGQVGQFDLSWFTNYWIPYFWQGPFIATVHDLLHLYPELFPAHPAKRFASKMMFRRLCKRANGVIFVSEATKSEFHKLSGVPRHSAVIHHGADHISPTPGVRKTATALTVGARKLHKNLDLVLSAWAKAKVDNWQLVVVSPGDPLRSSVGLDAECDTIQFHSGISDAELAALYGKAKIFLFPSKYEGFGFPLLEAAMNSMDILVSDTPALQEIASGMTVHTLAPDDMDAWVRKIRQVTGNLSDQETLARNKKKSEGYKWRGCAEKTVAFLEASLPVR